MYFIVRNYSKFFLQRKRFTQNILLLLHSQIFKMNSTLAENNSCGDLSILKSIGNLKIEFKNKFTCFLTRCIFCNNMSLYINKVTGKFCYHNT